MKHNKSQRMEKQGSFSSEVFLGVALFLLIGLLGAWLVSFTPGIVIGQPYNETALLNTTVNITNAAPVITAIALDTPINLQGYANTTVFCNVSTFDYDNDTLSVNATFFLQGRTVPNNTLDDNNLYRNTSCAPTTNQDLNMNWTCAFQVEYYADNSSSWTCNATASDGGLIDASNLSNNATINPLVAIRVPGILDYGNLAAGEISNISYANITNAGNRNATIAVEGYGATPGDGLAFTCDFGSIGLEFERYNASNNLSTFDQMTQLTNVTTNISNFYVPHRTSETSDSINTTYWRVQIPVGAGGVCTGFILFTASDQGT